MWSVLRYVIIALLVLGGLATPVPRVSAANLDVTADRVFGQPGFTTNTANNGGIVSANSLNTPQRAAVDAQGNLYVADTFNHRVLEYDAPLTAGATADRVFGQPGFTTNTANNGGISAHSLSSPYGVAVDSLGNLYVADTGNDRLLEYDTPLATDNTADRVFGQPGFTTNIPNNGGLSASSLSSPVGVALDAQGNLYVADNTNNRVLEYNNPLATDTTADRVFGQPDFSSSVINNGGISASSLYSPYDVEVSAQGDLYVADFFNNRVLEYNNPLAAGTTADLVIGQPDFTSNTINNGGLSASSLWNPKGVSLSAQGDLYVADNVNNRVLEYNTPLTAGTTADRVFGQPNFTSNTTNNGGISANSLYYPSGVALDAQGNLYVNDVVNHRLLEYDIPVPYVAPTLSALNPSTVAAGSPAFTLTVSGSSFVLGSIVRWNGSNRPTTYLNSMQINATISSADVAGGGPFAVTVFTPAPGGGTSALTNLTLYLRNGQDTAADGVLGQPNFTASTPNNTLLPGGANRLRSPFSVSVDPQSARLFVADSSNHRVLSWPNALTFTNGQAADLVIGQPNLSSGILNNGGISANSLNSPLGVAVDAQGNLYVSDNGNHRVLEYTAPLTNGMAASRVFGQGGSFTTALPNNGGISANSLNSPTGVALDSQGNLYVADSANNRVLEYDTPLSAGTTADRVFGQLNFTTATANNGGLSPTSLNSPVSAALDSLGNLYVADNANHRVLEYNTPLSAGTGADHVFGQPDFTSNTVNNGGLSAHSLNFPEGVTLDTRGNLYLVDAFNHRVLEYDAPLTTDMTADRVFGQPNLTSNTSNNGGVSANGLFLPMGVALDIHGDLFVTDNLNHRLLEFDPIRFKVLLPVVKR